MNLEYYHIYKIEFDRINIFVYNIYKKCYFSV